MFFSLYSPRKFTIEPAANEKIDSEVTAFLQKNSRGFITSKFRTDEINEPFYGKHRLWLEILNKFFQDNIETKKDNLLVSLSLGQKTLSFNMYRAKRRQLKEKKSYTPKNKKADRQLLIRYDFAYAGRDTVNQTAKVAPDIIKKINNKELIKLFHREANKLSVFFPEF